jgi:hypothetical protein
VDFSSASEAEVLQACGIRLIALAAVAANIVCRIPGYIYGEL